MPDTYGTFGSYLADTLTSNRAFAKQYATDEALKAFAVKPDDPAAQAALIVRNPTAFSQVVNARTGAAKVQAEADAAKAAAYQDAIAQWAQGGQRGPRPVNPSTPMQQPQAPSSPTSIVSGTVHRPGASQASPSGQQPAPDEMVVQAPAPKMSNEEVIGLLDPKHAAAYLQTKKMFGELDEQGQKQVVAQAGAIDALRPQMLKMSPEERLSYIEDNRSMLQHAGWTDAQINSFVPTDDNLAAVHHQALGAKDAQREAESDRSFGETVRSHKATEGQGATRLGLESRRVALAERDSAGEAGIDPATLAYAGTIYRHTGVVPNLGYGKAGAAARKAVIGWAASAAADDAGGMQNVSNQAGFVGQKAGARTMGTTTAKVDYGVNELTASIPLARAASIVVPRGNFVPVNRLNNIIARGGGSAEQRDFAVKTQATINAYNLVAARAGSSMAEREHNTTLLTTADSPRAYAAALAAMAQEGQVAKGASRKTMNEITGRGAGVPADVQAILKKYGH